MLPNLFKAVVSNDIETFLSLKNFFGQETVQSNNTVLHLAARFGHFEIVSEIVKLRPDLVEVGNKKKDTPLHEASRAGHDKIVMLLLQTNPWAACLLNCEDQNALFVACCNGHLNVVKLLLNQPWLLDFEEDGNNYLSSLHASISRGHSEIVRKILELRPNLTHKADRTSSSPLHCACSKEHLEITKMLLKLDPDLANQYDHNGYTPLHLVAMKGNVEILEEFLTFAPTSFHSLSGQGDSIFHLSVRYKQYGAFKYLAQIFRDTSILHCVDQFGNTVLHLAVSGGLSNFVDYIITETTVDINYVNKRGRTALDIFKNAKTPEMFTIKDMLMKAGGKESNEIEIPLVHDKLLANEHKPVLVENELSKEPVEVSSKHKVAQNENQNTTEPSESGVRANNSSSTLRQHKILSRRNMKDLRELHKTQQNMQYEMYIEALQNARNTIILVAILIATVTFTAGISPPGGVYQEGRLKGQSTVGRTTAFKIFTISNNIALFTSLCLVIVLVSIIPFRRKQLARLLVVAHKIMWVAVSFMATAYVAATWVILPHGSQGEDWTLEAIVTISAGSMGMVFLFLGVVLARHWLSKLKWRRERFDGGKIDGIDENGENKKSSDLLQPDDENGENKKSSDLLQPDDKNGDKRRKNRLRKMKNKNKMFKKRIPRFDHWDSFSVNSDVGSATSSGHGYHVY